jgi:hypothetical protein
MTVEGRVDQRGAAGAHRPLLRYFDEVLPVEQEAIGDRRARTGRPALGGPRRLSKPNGSAHPPREDPKRETPPRAGSPPSDPTDIRLGGATPPDEARSHPQPRPGDATGLALSGGGIRSAAFCLGALQALEIHGAIDGLDYLSTVSGGGYTGACMTAAMSGGGDFPFQDGADPRDSIAVGHLRNYSNYLVPRDRTPARNFADNAAIILRGLLANALLVLMVLILLALLTIAAYPQEASLGQGSFLPRLSDAMLRGGWLDRLAHANDILGPAPFRLTVWALAVLAALLMLWVVLRSLAPYVASQFTAGDRPFAWTDDDADGPLLGIARYIFWFAALCALLDLQPILIHLLDRLYRWGEARQWTTASVGPLLGMLTAFVGAIGAFADTLGRFLKISQRSDGWRTLALRIATSLAIWIAALLLPLLLLLGYLHLSAWGMAGLDAVWRPFDTVASHYLLVFIPLLALAAIFQPNAYSLHRIYRDRLSKAFLFDPAIQDPQSGEPKALDDFKLSAIGHATSPYHIINAAMNVQGSLAANRRGRDADFFTFTRDFIGSDLTLYARTHDIERIDPTVDLAAAMAVSGAAISANMGANTVRPLSPTLALLNIRLGYWLRNPRDLAKPKSLGRRGIDLARFLLNRFYLLLEIFNLLDEKRGIIYLTDGGHIENLGIYELLKRGCQLIVAVDAEADPTLAFPSLVRLERYARIDLGVRIDLPWPEIALRSRAVDRSAAKGRSISGRHGPHCAIGRILYPGGTEGILLYVKSSLSGDEPDYVLDYKKRYPSFPHETTGDQFFSEEQFEAYRALGFHAVDRCLGDAREDVPIAAEWRRSGVTQRTALDWVRTLLR